MSNTQTPHLQADEMLRFVDGELSGDEADAFRSHIERCVSCRARVAEIETVSGDYQRYREIVGRQLPAPPEPWANLEPRFEEIERTLRPATVRRSAWRPAGWLAAAAAVALAFFVLRSFIVTPRVSAAELLRKASAAPQVAGTERRIRVKLRGRTFTRAAALTSAAEAGDSGVRALFERANFSWQEPLSARSFASWRDGLPHKQDETKTLGDSYVIQTSTSESELHKATLTLRKRDLQPTREMLEFTSETVEITAAPDDDIAADATRRPESAPMPGSAHAPNSNHDAFSKSHRDVEVFAALHRIGADLGEPVEIRENGSRLLVTGTGLTAAQQQDLRASLSEIPDVELRFDDAKPNPAPDSSPAHQAEPATAPPQLRLQALLGARGSVEDFIDRTLDASDAMMARAHALRALAKAFPANTEAAMNADDRAIIASLRRDHIAAMKSRVNELGNILAPVLKTEASAERASAPPANWQSAVQELFSNAQALDDLLNRSLAGPDAAAQDEDFRRITAALARVRTQLAVL